MPRRHLFSLALLACVCFGFAAEAYAVGPCAAVCRGQNEPCSLRCYLPGPFVTTCGQLGPCANFAVEPELGDGLTEAVAGASCSLEVATTFATDDNGGLTAIIVAGFRDGLELVERVGGVAHRLRTAMT